MPSEDTFVEQVKQRVLYTQRNSGDVASMLDISKANKILNPDMAKWTTSVNAISSSMKGNYKNLFSDVILHIESQNMSIDAQSREQAIKMKGEGTREEKIKGKGLFGFLQKNNDN